MPSQCKQKIHSAKNELVALFFLTRSTRRQQTSAEAAAADPYWFYIPQNLDYKPHSRVLTGSLYVEITAYAQFDISRAVSVRQ